MRRLPAAAMIALMAASMCWAILPAQRSRNTNRLGDLHLGGVFGFEPNVGQAGRGVAFVARGRDYALTLSSSELVLTYLEGFGDVDQWFHEEVVRLKLEQARSSVETAGLDPLPGKSVFRLRADIPNYARVLFQEVYPGIDLVCSGSQKRLELQFVIRAGARPEAIRLAWDGARRARVGSDGTLAMRTPLGEIRLLAPITYNSFDGERQAVPGRFVRLARSRAGFQLLP